MYPEVDLQSLIRLNTFISSSGLCSRRKADQLILAGAITVDGRVVQEIGSKVSPDAIVAYKQNILRVEKKRYIILNKPRGYVTTTKDPEGRKTVLNLISKQDCIERIYPVGRLDYKTTGLLLLTNDGSFAQNLSHPSKQIKKIYHVVIDKPITTHHIHCIQHGLLLEDGPVHVDNIRVVDELRYQLHIEIHIGRNRIIRRIFESLGYSVLQLDRIAYAHFTKKGIPLGKCIELQPKDIHKLKQSYNSLDNTI